jgi:hypothetical protein
MRAVREHIETHCRALAAHPFLSEMRPHRDPRRALAFALVIAPWVMIFQDVIRINAQRAEDPAIKQQLGRHVLEDQDHARWFLADMDYLFGTGMPDVAWMFGRETAVTREASLAIASEVFRIRDDALRLVLVEALEASARLFMERVLHLVGASEGAEHLQYFGLRHEQAEAGHEMFEDDAARDTHEIELPDSTRTEAKALVDRIFHEFSRIAQEALRASLPSPQDCPALPPLPQPVS